MSYNTVTTTKRVNRDAHKAANGAIASAVNYNRSVEAAIDQHLLVNFPEPDTLELDADERIALMTVQASRKAAEATETDEDDFWDREPTAEELAKVEAS